MKKKILALCLVLALAVTAIGGATLAYFTDTDSAKNVMTTGNVKIYQNEQQRTLGDEVDNDAQHQSIRKEQDGLEDFEDNKKLAPFTGSVNADGKATSYDGTINLGGKDRNMFANDKNAIDKIVTVTNEGTEAAYARTIFAWEMIPVKNETGEIVSWDKPFNTYVVSNCIVDIYGYGMLSVKDENGDIVTFKKDGVMYAVCEYYHGELQPGETSIPSLMQIYLNANVDNEFYDAVGATYDILTLSQATQAQGFTDCKVALDTAFGAVADADLDEWFKDVA